MTTIRFDRWAWRTLGRAAGVAVLGVLALGLAGCGGSSSGSSSGAAKLRVFNAIAGGNPATVTVGTKTVASNLAFEGLTTYGSVTSGSQEFKVTLAGATSPSIDAFSTLAADANYSYLLYGTASAPAALLVQDLAITLTSGQFGLRVTNAAFGKAALDVYVTAPGAALNEVSPNVTGVAYAGTVSSALTAGALQVRFTLPNSKQVIYDAGTTSFASGATYYLVAYTKGSGTLVNAALLQLDSTGTGALANSKIAQFKLVHAAPGTGPVNALVGGKVVYSNVPYQGVTSYGSQASGSNSLTFEAQSSPGAVIASAQPQFAAATDTSVALTGLPGAQTALVLNDSNLPGSTGSARVRIVNVAPNTGAVDVLVNYAVKVSSLATNSASAYVELVEDAYTINFTSAGTTTLLLSMPGVTFTAGRTYTLYLVGAPGQLSGLLTRDQ